MRRRGPLAVLLAVLLWSCAAAQTWGVRLDVELPVDAGAAEFVANPVRYALDHRDVVDLRAFVELERIGFEGRWRSSTEAFVGFYYRLSSISLLGQSAESSVGLYVGRDFRASQTYLALRGSILLYGRLP